MELKRIECLRTFISILVLCAVAVTSQQPEFPLSPTTSAPSLQVDGSSGAVFVAAGRRVYRLDDGLVERDAATLGSEVLNIALSSDGANLVACLSDFSCVVLNASQLSAAPSLVAAGVHGATDDGITLFTAGDGSFYVGSTRVNGMGVQTHILLGRHGGAFNRTVEYEINRGGFVRNFFGGFTSGSNAYFLVYDTAPTAPDDLRNVRVMRVCDDGGFNALYERRLFCGASIGSGTDVAGASVIDGFTGTPGSALALGQGRPGGSQNYVCVLTISSDVDAEMDMRYSECVTSRLAGDDIEVAWNDATSLSNCAQFQEVDMCRFNLPLDNVDDPVASNQDLLRINELNGDFLTASVAVVLDSASFMVTAFMRRNTQEYYVSVVDFTTYTGTDPLIPSNVAIDTIPVSSKVLQLRWQPGLDYVYALTDTTVARVPIADCASRTNCSSCLAYDNPLCGWCIVENKCSRMSECQNSAARWVQSTDPTGQCMTISITPDNFVTDRPEILSLTVSPGLPALLINESYRCHLADLQGRFPPIVVPAVQVVARTQYTCNITGEVPSFSGSQAAIAFSFVSSLAGVPFDTNTDALAIFVCPAATSCMECLQTQDACGWCNYMKVCSGTDAPCVNSSSYLQLAGAGSFSEVCPLLRPSSTGSYNQPVATATNLPLITSNLPAPFDPFSYRCTVNGMDLPAMFNNDSSITCVVGQTDLPLTSPNSGGIESADVSIRWTGPNALNHTIGALETGIDVTLYDCSQLATGCSTCLAAVIAPSFDCGWCDPAQGCQFVGASCGSTHITQGASCPAPIITRFTPVSGPTEGGTLITIEGTDLGVVFQDIATITISTSPCTPVEATYQSGVNLQCETTSGVSSGLIRVTRGGGRVGDSSQAFAVVSPAISGVEPAFGPMAGGSRVRVQGSNLAAGNSMETTVTLEGTETLACAVMTISDNEINCTTAEFNGSVPQSAPVVVHIDNADISSQGVEFTYRSNPTFTSISPVNTIPAGGIILSFTGENFDVVSNPVIRITDTRFGTTISEESCVAVTAMLLNCTAPELQGGPAMATNITYTVVVDNALGPVNLPLSVLPDPTNFVLGVTEHALGTDTFINIEGDNLDSVEVSEYRVTVGGQECAVTSGSPLFCQPPTDPLGGPGLAAVVVFVGGNIEVPLSQELEYIVPDAVPLVIIIPCVVGGLLLVVAFSVCLICCIACCYNSRARKKEKQWTNLLAQMELMEMEMAEECKRAFTELQTDLADLVQISADKNLPYRDFRTFAMRFLFPQGGDDHPVLLPLQLPEKSEKNNVMQDLETFRQLLMNKTFLLVFVRTLESQGYRFTLQDKCTVASLLMVAFQNDLDYATEILQTLLAELMRKTVSHPKLLLRRTESIAEKMLANWLAFLLYPYLLEHVGEPLFILYRAIKSQLEKGPVDVVSGDARHSLSEEKLLRQHHDVKSVEAVIETESGEEVAIKLLDCDSITQAKEKILDALYKNTPVSKRPQLTDIDLELCRGSAGIPLRDQDATNLKEGDWIKINTLGHYKLDEMSQAHIDNPKNPVPKFRVVRRSERPLSGMSFDTIGTIISNANANRSSVASLGDLPHIFHLVKPELDEGESQQKIVSEVFLTRLLSTKRILQPYVDALFNSMFAVPHGRALPKAIKSLFDFLDLQAAELGIQDPETLHTWKTNSVPLRFWVNVIKNPDFVFDINKSATVDACLTVIAQAYIDSCSTAELKYTKETPSARLLYVNEVKSYKTAVSQYYGSVQSLPKLSPHEMGEYLRETAQVCATSMTLPDNDTGPASMTRQLYFVTESALYELFKFAAQYSGEIVDSLNEEGHTSLAGKFDHLTKSISY